MNNRIIYYLIGLIFFIHGCKPDKEEIRELTYHIDKVVCQANSNFFVADGISKLGLEVKLYTKAGTYTDIYGNTQQKYKEIPVNRWKSHTIKFFDRSGKEYPADFSSKDVTEPFIDFYAEVDGIRSSKPVLQLLAEFPETGEGIEVTDDPTYFRMQVRQADPIPSLKKIPVVFHIVDVDKAKEQMQELNSDAVYFVIDLYNKVFGRKNSVASNGANPNIEFVPAIRDPNGKILQEVGINRIYLTETQNKVDFSINYVLETPSLYWNTEQYLNIWIVTASGWANTTEANRYIRSIPFAFAKGSYDPEKFPLPASVSLLELEGQEAIDSWKKKPAYLENVGLVFHKKSDGFAQLYPDYVSQMSAFLGVIPNGSVSETKFHFGSPKAWVDDYCEDTFIYNPYYATASKGGLAGTEIGSSRVKYTVSINANKTGGVPGFPWIEYFSANTGEQGSFQSVITQDQARRIEWSLNNAIGRQMWKDDYAIRPIGN